MTERCSLLSVCLLSCAVRVCVVIAACVSCCVSCVGPLLSTPGRTTDTADAALSTCAVGQCVWRVLLADNGWCVVRVTAAGPSSWADRRVLGRERRVICCAVLRCVSRCVLQMSNRLTGLSGRATAGQRRPLNRANTYKVTFNSAARTDQQRASMLCGVCCTRCDEGTTAEEPSRPLHSTLQSAALQRSSTRPPT